MNLDDLEIEEIVVPSDETGDGTDLGGFDETSTGETRVRADSHVQVRDDDLPAKIGEKYRDVLPEHVVKQVNACALLAAFT